MASNISFQKILLCANVRHMIETSLLITMQSVNPNPIPPWGYNLFQGIVPSVRTYRVGLFCGARRGPRGGNPETLCTCMLELRAAVHGLSFWTYLDKLKP